MQIYNTLTREKEEFKSLKDNVVKVYYCGPTVYNYAHIGNLKTYTGNDVIVRAMKFLGYPVQTTMNITDIDDKTIRDSLAAGEELKSFTQKYTKEFLSDIEKLSIKRADNIEPISNVIPEMVRMINTMLSRGFAYLSTDGSIYYKIKAFKKYGKLANLDMDSLKESVRIDNDEYDKDSASDFALWKAYDQEKDGANFWEETFAIDGKEQKVKGRPGWHIECSACAMKHFGPQIDIHMGGVDLIFPHHQNEIAQTEACTRKTFSKYWVHHGHLMVDGKKMSKSLGNFYTLRDLEEKFSSIPKDVLYSAIRLNFINCKYRDGVDLSFDKLEANFTTVKRVQETLKNVVRNIAKPDGVSLTDSAEVLTGISREFREDMQGVMQDFIACLEDDFNMPEALALLFSFQKYVNSGIAEKKFSTQELESILDMYEQLDSVFGIINWENLEEDNHETPAEIQELLSKRDTAKADKDFETADSLRDKLLEKGYKIIDSREGSRVDRV